VFSSPTPGHSSDFESAVTPDHCIQFAIDDVKAGDIIIVDPGEYYEYLTITKDSV
jgi:hypothetical protein